MTVHVYLPPRPLDPLANGDIAFHTLSPPLQTQDTDPVPSPPPSLPASVPQPRGTLPFLNASDSHISLNTTISNISLSQSGDTSLAQLPTWRIPLSKLTALHTLLEARSFVRGAHTRSNVFVIVCVTAVDPAMLRRRKEERARGVEGTLWVGKWNVVVQSGDTERGCEVRLWDELAREWDEYKVRRGDVLLLENAEFRPATVQDKAQLVLSAHSSPKVTILYRTLPRYSSTSIIPEDMQYRPDLRLGRSDPGVRRVSDIVQWFSAWLG